MSKALLGILVILSMQSGWAQTASQQKIALNSAKGLELINVEASVTKLHGKKAIQVKAARGVKNHETLVLIPDVSFSNGVIEIEVAGEPAPGAFPQARGFVGLAFRVNKPDAYEYECFYLRPTNGRAENQVQRNHSIQYVSHPEYPWYELREKFPEKYESYADLVPGEWTKLKIEVSGVTAKFYVNNMDQPNLIVKDLKGAKSEGGIALWLHSSTLAHYRNLIITPND